MKFKYLFIFLVLSVLFIGCSKEDCSLKDTTYQKYSYNEDTKKCVVSKTIKENVCGNGIDEEKETYCNCPKDVLKTHPIKGCEGKIGLYIEKSCDSEKKCVIFQNAKVTSLSKVVEFRNSDMSFNGYFDLNSPFIQNTADENKVKIDITLIKTTSSGLTITDIYIKEISLEDSSSTLLGKAIYEESINLENNKLKTKIIPLNNIAKYETKDQIRIKMLLTYKKNYLDSSGNIVKTDPVTETLQSSLGAWTIINPDLYEPPKK